MTRTLRHRLDALEAGPAVYKDPCDDPRVQAAATRSIEQILADAGVKVTEAPPTDPKAQEAARRRVESLLAEAAA